MTYFEIMEMLRDVNALGVALRFALALLCGGIIGLERESKRRSAGFRTHTLVCIGATLTTLVGLFLYKSGLSTDPTRLGAQVINGIGFLGAGTIIVTKRKQVKGLTTAAGLWTSAIVGLCCGAAFFEGAILATVIILIAELAFVKLEYSVFRNSRAFNLYVEYTGAQNLGAIVDAIKKAGVYVKDIEITKNDQSEKQACAIFSLQMPKKQSHQELITILTNIDGVNAVEEL